jgi:hypothetical protein
MVSSIKCDGFKNGYCFLNTYIPKHKGSVCLRPNAFAREVR